MEKRHATTRTMPPCPPSGPGRVVWFKFMAALTDDPDRAQHCRKTAQSIEARQAADPAPLPLFDREA